MICLAINTLQAACDVALVQGDECSEIYQPMTRGQDAALPALVDSVVTGAGFSLREIDRLAVVTGPGSFTGVRIGVSYARGLALALGVPCVGVTSLEACIAPTDAAARMVALQAQKRPPDITFWCQSVSGLERSGSPREVSLAEMIVHQGPVFTDRADLIPGARSEAAPCACIAAMRAMRVDPQAFPPNPAYVRAPDAVLPKTSAP